MRSVLMHLLMANKWLCGKTLTDSLRCSLTLTCIFLTKCHFIFYFQIAQMAYNHTDTHVSYPLQHITPSSLSVAFVGLSSSPSFNMSNQLFSNTTNGKGRDISIMSNGSGAVTGAAILGLVFLLGVPGNIFIIWSILARARRRSITTLLILNLAFADGFLMLLTPFFVVYLFKRSWIFGLALCKILFYLCCANMYASIFLIMLMSLHRLVAIVWPKHVGALSNRRTVLRLLIVLWILALGLSAPPLFFRTDSDLGSQKVCHCKHPKPQYVSQIIKNYNNGNYNNIPVYSANNWQHPLCSNASYV